VREVKKKWLLIHDWRLRSVDRIDKHSKQLRKVAYNLSKERRPLILEDVVEEEVFNKLEHPM